MTEMTSFKRVMSAIELKEVDRIPVIPQLTYASAYYANLGIDEALTDSMKQKEALVNSQIKGGYDGIYAGWEGSFVLLASSLGADLKIYRDKPPSTDNPLIKTRADLEALPQFDPNSQGRVPLNLQLIRSLKAKVKDVPILSYIPGAFTLGSLFLGLTQFMITLMRDKLNILEDLLNYTYEATIAFGKAKIAAGADMITIADPSGSTDMVSPKLFEQHSFPLLKKAITTLKKDGVKVGLHICGQTKPILSKMAETGADYLELDSKVDLPAAQRNLNGKICLMGNISTSDLTMKTPHEIKQLCNTLLTNMGLGFILSSGCEIAYSTPLENIQAMVESVKVMK
ncbi:MAG: uroporphyrinogen decarboxylase family protein [Candidatus Helarchaeota archaeon]